MQPFKIVILALVLIAGAFALQACGEGSNDSSGSAPMTEDETCMEGLLDCACIGGPTGACFADLVCLDGVCAEVTCNPGEEGCACYANNSCNRLDSGEFLECGTDGLCGAEVCPTGSQGCACEDGSCAGALECNGNSICDAVGCEAGLEGCACLSGDACDGSLVCQNNACVVLDCNPGDEGCACQPGAVCAGGLECGAGDVCQPIGCTLGSIGCFCDEGSCAAADAYCDADGRCQQVDCLEGDEGCACSVSDVCGLDNEGNQLECEGGVCRTQLCAPGLAGCACEFGYNCVGNSECSGGICRPLDCVVGNEHCECVGGGCAPGLSCLNNTVCADNTGNIGGGCFENGTCDRGGLCDASSNTCVTCRLGSQACSCDDAGECSTGLACTAGTCIAEAAFDPRIPDPLFCVTPCNADYTDDAGNVVSCGVDGYLEGCIDDRECVEGSCVSPGEATPTCVLNSDCPQSKTCIEGQCYSQCKTNLNCAEIDPSLFCSDYVCRIPCDTITPCPTGMSCVNDGERGFCFDLVPTDEDVEPITTVTGDFELSETVVTMTNTSPTGSFQIVNNSDYRRNFTIKKLSHTVWNDDFSLDTAVRSNSLEATCDDGSEACICYSDDNCPDGSSCSLGECRPRVCTAGSCPMFWLGLGERSATSPVDEVEVGVDAGQGLTIELSDSNGSSGVRWIGEVEVSNAEMGAQKVQLQYNEVPEGQWVGTVHYFADFGTHELLPENSTCLTEDDLGFDPEECESNDECSGADVCINGQCAEPCNAIPGQVAQSNCDSGMVCVKGGCCGLNAWTLKENPPVDDEGGNTQAGRLNTRDDNALQEKIGNALVQRWGAFRRGAISWDEFQAVLRATESGSWKYNNVQEACNVDACYLYSLGGVREYSSDVDTVPVPAGSTQLPIVMNLKLDENDENGLVGRIVSERALQYAGDPSIHLKFNASPNTCARQTAESCLVFVEEMEAEIYTGGRYTAESSDSACEKRGSGDNGYAHKPVPWLVPGFTHGTELLETGQRERYECRDSMLPFNTEENEDLASENFSQALSNPIPDGRTRRRVLKVLDGALVNQSTMLIFFEERFVSFLGEDDPEGFASYGYMVMSRNPTDLTTDGEDAYLGTSPVDEREPAEDVLKVTCDDTILTEVLGNQADLYDSGSAETLVHTILRGEPSVGAQVLTENDSELAHVLCFDTGLINGGPDANDDVPVRTECPVDSEVAYFTMSNSHYTYAEITDLACQQDGSCLNQLDRWRTNNLLIQDPPVWRCSDNTEVYCDDNRLDLLADKSFYADTNEESVFVPLQVLIENAFRYKTRFQTRRGENPGFAPEICVPNSNAIPYCYDPDQITTIFNRTDCLLNVWSDDELYNDLSDLSKSTLNQYLRVSFSYDEEYRDDLALPLIHDGFEQLNAELLIMMGDESYTQAFASRFDLAGATVSFEGDKFEENGINLSGIVGYEMYSLYQATQYYQMTLDRFYAQSPLVWRALMLGRDSDTSDRNFITPETVILYFDRLIRASTQKSKASAEIAKRYNAMNRSDLAKRVAERSYTATYLESIVLSRMMLGIVDVVEPENRAQIKKAVEEAQLRYRSALLDMQEVHASVGDQLTVFGFEPDYIPLPPLDTGDFRQSNAFELIQRRLEPKVQLAREREQRALDSNRSFDTDAAQFQSELSQIRRTYDEQLGNVCGTFIGPDGQSYPATESYAYLDETASTFGNPCGLMGNGSLHNQKAEIELARISFQTALTRYNSTLDQIDIELDTASQQCGLIIDRANFTIKTGETTRSLEQEIRDEQFEINRWQSGVALGATLTGPALCSGTACLQAGTVALAYTALHGTAESYIVSGEQDIQEAERDITDAEQALTAFNINQECDVLTINTNSAIKNIRIQRKELRLEVLRAEYQHRLTYAELSRLLNESIRLESERKESEQMLINVQAAHNNPNVRIYKNDDIINAEFSFEDALRETYKLTRVFEYYTSQSYAHRDDLFLVRMVSHGEPNLENYVTELVNAFYEFEELFSSPELRVMKLSLMEDVFRIPKLDDDGAELSASDRTEMFRKRLTDRALLDRNGYITVPFSTNLSRLSPLTRNHKISYVEVDLHANSYGDFIGRVYLRQNGTGVIHTLSDVKDYYRFDERTAVVNLAFSGTRWYGQNGVGTDIYKNYRLRDRPLVNTSWELVFNQRDEVENQDIDLTTINDIYMLVFYSDFTSD